MHKGGVMGLISTKDILLGFILLPLVTFAFAETDSPSFYGKRSVSSGEHQPQKEAITFQRRAISIMPENSDLAVKIAREPELDVSNDIKHTVSPPSPLPLPLVELSRNEKLLAKKAQYYFDQNWNKKTGFTDSVQGYHHVTMWDVASDISAQLSLEGLGLQSEERTNIKLQKLLTTLKSMPLYKDKLPNREYDTKTGKPSGRYSKAKTNGNGWSALDVGRLLIWLHIIKQEKEELAPLVDNIVSKWSLASSVHNKTLYGTKLGKQSEHYRQEGRLGYLQYAAFGFALFGFDVSDSYLKKDIEKVNIDDVSFYIDTRNMPFSTADPYVLMTLELGNYSEWWQQLDVIYELYKQKEKRTNRLWVFSEDAMNRSPWFAYNNIFYYGKSWLSTSAGGKPVETFQIFSNKIALGLSVIFDDDYAKKLKEQVIDNSINSRVIPTGLYSDGLINSAYNINTNSMVLSSLWYKVNNSSSVLKRGTMLKGITGNVE